MEVVLNSKGDKLKNAKNASTARTAARCPGKQQVGSLRRTPMRWPRDANRQTAARHAPVVYFLLDPGSNKSYIGYTVNLEQRLRQHRGEVRSGGARYTRGFRMKPVLLGCTGGFSTERAARQYEWRSKRRRPRSESARALAKRSTHLIRPETGVVVTCPSADISTNTSTPLCISACRMCGLRAILARTTAWSHPRLRWFMAVLKSPGCPQPTPVSPAFHFVKDAAQSSGRPATFPAWNIDSCSHKAACVHAHKTQIALLDALAWNK
jgi:predicted GIY-YIG superfamily endonuclease